MWRVRKMICDNCISLVHPTAFASYCKLGRMSEATENECSYRVEIKNSDIVNNPSHYNSHPSGIECIEIVKCHDFCTGNAIKYLWRAGLKENNSEIQDLKKAAYYINQKIKDLEGKNE